MGVSTAREKSPTPKLLTALSTTPKPSNSSTSTCRTSSPSPRIRENETSNSAVASPGFFSTRPTGASPTRLATPSQGPSTTSPAGTSWDQFDEPPLSCGPGGRESRRRKSRFQIIIVYRGDWCQSSIGLLRGFAGLYGSVKGAEGEIFAITSQSRQHAAKVAKEHNLPFKVVGDPTNGHVEEMNRRFAMNCSITMNDIVRDSYPRGMAQCCILAVCTDDVQDESSVLYKWWRYQTIGTVRYGEVLNHVLDQLRERTSRESASGPRAGETTAEVPQRHPTPAPRPFPAPRLPYNNRNSLASDASQGSTPPQLSERTPSQMVRTTSRRNIVGSTAPHRGIGSHQGSQRQAGFAQPSPARRIWPLWPGGAIGGTPSFVDDDPGGSAAAAPTPRHGAGRPSDYRSNAYGHPNLKTHDEEEKEEEDEDDEEEEEDGNERAVGHNALLGMPQRSGRLGHTASFARRPGAGAPPGVLPPPPEYSQVVYNPSSAQPSTHRPHGYRGPRR